jgi:nitrogen fixation protein NifQ
MLSRTDTAPPFPLAAMQEGAPDCAAGAYALLMAGRDADDPNHFDLHVLACILALAVSETAGDLITLSDRSGLSRAALASLAGRFFAHADWLRTMPADDAVPRGTDEDCLLDLLTQCVTDRTPLASTLAAMIARRAQSPNHLWQDLGLRNRGELSRLMHRHFRALAARNTGDMKWKKFLYRMICRDAGYALCTAPSCSECCDFALCFGDESGESRLARARRATEAAAA